MGNWEFRTTAEWEGAIGFWLNEEQEKTNSDPQSALSARLAASLGALKWLELFAKEQGDNATEAIPVWSEVLEQMGLAAEGHERGNELAGFYYQARAQLIALKAYEERFQ